MSDQTNFKRYEIKYIVTKDQYKKILESMAPYMREDEHGMSRIQSLYFDTPNNILARRSLDKPMYKEKLRLRSYGLAQDGTKVFVEIKKKYDGVVYKRRIDMTSVQSNAYLPGMFSGTPEARRFLLKAFVNSYKDGTSRAQIVKEIDYFLGLYKGIRPAMMLQYDRDAFYAVDDHEFRITFDDNIRWRTTDLRMDKGFYGNLLLDEDHILMEVKVGGAMPAWFVKILTENKIYKTSFSKYGTAYVINSGLASRLPASVKDVLNDRYFYELEKCI